MSDQLMLYNILSAASNAVTETLQSAPEKPAAPVELTPFAKFMQDGLFGKIVEGIEVTDYVFIHYFAFVAFHILLIAIPYLLGSLNFGIITSRKLYHDDVRLHGSGNAGLTNTYRTWGKRAAVYVLLGDSLKAIVSVILGYTLLGINGAYLAAFFCMLGHMFPIFFKFKGGKGVLTVGAALILLDPVVFIILLTVFILTLCATKFVSMASCLSMFLYPIFLSSLRGYGTPVLFAFLMTGFVVFMHRANLKRIWNQEEPKFSFKKKAEQLSSDEPKKR